jgi:hypothetical protein
VLRLLTRRAVSAVAVGLAAGASGGFALADAVGGSISVPAQKAAALERLMSVATTDSRTEPAPVPQSAPHPLPGQMLDADAPVPISPSVLRPSNGWLVSDGRKLVAVYAGSAGDDASLGRVVIVRQDLAAGEQRVRVLDAGRSGALVIVGAPLGSAVETSAQTGKLRLGTSGGGQLALDLSTEKLSHDVNGTRLP